MLFGYRRLPLRHRCTVGIDREPPMCLDAQGGHQGKAPTLFVAGVCLEVMCLGRGRRDVLSCTFCQMLELRILAPLLDWKRCSQALSRHHSYHPGFEVHVSLRATAFSMFREEICRVEICSVVLLEVRVAPLRCTGPVQPGRCSSRASSSR